MRSARPSLSPLPFESLGEAPPGAIIYMYLHAVLQPGAESRFNTEAFQKLEKLALSSKVLEQAYKSDPNAVAALQSFLSADVERIRRIMIAEPEALERLARCMAKSSRSDDRMGKRLLSVVSAATLCAGVALAAVRINEIGIYVTPQVFWALPLGAAAGGLLVLGAVLAAVRAPALWVVYLLAAGLVGGGIEGLVVMSLLLWGFFWLADKIGGQTTLTEDRPRTSGARLAGPR